MKTLIGGSIAAVCGLIGLGLFWQDFFDLLAGAIPVLLLIGGALAIYLGFDELKDSWKSESGDAVKTGAEESEKYKQEIDDLKKEIETLKSDKD